MRILVSGGSGFIGSNLIDHLEDNDSDDEIWTIERYMTGRHGLEKDVLTYFADLRNYFEVRRAIREIQPDVVFHLAAVSAVSYSYDHPHEVLDVNLGGTVNLAEACLREANIEAFIMAGSSEMYGIHEDKEDGFKETDTYHPNSPYAISKVAAVNYLNYMHYAYDFPVVIAVPFNTYGRTRDTHFLIERAITQCLRGGEVNLGDPNTIRDWLFVDDHVNAYLSILDNREKALGETFNFCTGLGYTVGETVSKITELTGFKGVVNWHTIPQRPLDIKVLVGSNEKAKKVLGWIPEYDLEEGLKKTIRWLQEKEDD